MTTEVPKLCLNMIVKNESRIILRLLKSLVGIIDSYCICDTGSTDNTRELVETFFQENDIPGRVVFEPFRDFGYNRTYALKQCENQPNADYILLLDADMIFWKNPNLSATDFKRLLTKDAYYIYQGSDSFYYKNVRVVKNNRGTEYWGVTHEYVKTVEGSQYDLLDKNIVFINDIGDGGAKADKFERDVRLLKKGLEDHPNNDRYTFYLANSYRDAGDLHNAIETYKKRIELGGWYEEVWMSYYHIGRCYQRLGDMPNAIYYWLEAYQFFPKRLENLYEIITYYRNKGKNQLAYMYYVMAKKHLATLEKIDYLFLQKDVYDYKLDYEMSIIGYYCNYDQFDLPRICMKVLSYGKAEDGIHRNVLSNYKFYAKKIRDFELPIPAKNYELLQNIGKDLLKDSFPEFVESTPSIVLDKNGDLVVNVRYVNYRINSTGGYENQKHISTKNVMAHIQTVGCKNWVKKDEYELAYDNSIDNLYVGLEDVRLFFYEDEILYNANRGLSHHNIAVEHGVAGKTYIYEESGLISMEKQRSVEKNWVLFQDSKKNKKIIYAWHDIVIGDLVKQTVKKTLEEPTSFVFEKTHEIKTPAVFKYVRGSTNGVLIGNEIWFICHVVSYEDRRYYYHMFVVLDSTTYALKKYTTLFTFEKEKVEYTLGFVHYKDTNRFLIAYSKMDNCTNYLLLSKANIDSMMIIHYE